MIAHNPVLEVSAPGGGVWGGKAKWKGGGGGVKKLHHPLVGIEGDQLAWMDYGSVQRIESMEKGKALKF